jgi:hypothetical protein
LNKAVSFPGNGSCKRQRQKMDYLLTMSVATPMGALRRRLTINNQEDPMTDMPLSATNGGRCSRRAGQARLTAS